MTALLRWAGGKKWLLKDLNFYLPQKISNYIEPFLGSGVVSYKIHELFPNTKLFLSDISPELINFYSIVKRDCAELIELIRKHKNDSDYYYSVRKNISEDPIERAALFYFLNRTSYNGIYRVNKNGEYNVPFGHRELEDIVCEEPFYKFSSMLQNAVIECSDFFDTLKYCKKGSLYFLDPPYTHSHIKNGFYHYNQKLFSWEDQERLKMMVDKISQRGAFYILTNAQHELIINQYKDSSQIIETTRSSCIGGKNAFRGKISEIIITNINKG